MTSVDAAVTRRVGRKTRYLPGLAGPALAVGLAVVFPRFVAQYSVLVATLIFVFAIAAFGQVVVMGHTGVFHLGYAGLFALGGYLFVVLRMSGASLLLTIGIVLLAAVIFGALLGALAAWLGEFTFAIVSWGSSVIVLDAIKRARTFTGGLQGLVVPAEYRSPNLYLVTLVTLVVFGAATHFILNSWTGRRLRAVRDGSVAAAMFGLSPARVRFWAVALTSLYPATAGILYAQAIGYLGPDYFNKSLSLSFLIIAIVGGVRYVWGAMLGAVIWIITPELTASVVGGFPIVFGALAIIILLWRPDGLVGISIHGGDLIRRAFRGRSSQVGHFNATAAPDPASRSVSTHDDQGRSI